MLFTHFQSKISLDRSIPDTSPLTASIHTLAIIYQNEIMNNLPYISLNQFINFHKLIFFSLIITIACSCNVSDKQKPSTGDYQEFDDFFQSIENFSGNALVAIDGKSTYSKSFGYTSRELLVKKHN
jgi:hypothetical protein